MSARLQTPWLEPVTDALNQLIQGEAPLPVVELPDLSFETIVISLTFNTICFPDKPTYVLVSFPVLVAMFVLLVLAIVIILILAICLCKHKW